MTLVLAARRAPQDHPLASCQQLTLKFAPDLPLSTYGLYADTEVDARSSPKRKMIQAIRFSASVSADSAMMSPGRFAVGVLS